jgi:hypothetical protein
LSALSSLWEKLSRSKEYRESFAAAVAKRMIPLQIRILRKQRGPEWSQARLAKESKLTQGVVSRAEDPDYGNLTLNTLVRIAAGFDCAFIGRFVSFSEVGMWYTKLSDERSLEVPSFDEELAKATPTQKAKHTRRFRSSSPLKRQPQRAQSHRRRGYHNFRSPSGQEDLHKNIGSSVGSNVNGLEFRIVEALSA